MLLPGVSVLARLVARVGDLADQRLWDTIAALLSDGQRQVLEALLVSDAGSAQAYERTHPPRLDPSRAVSAERHLAGYLQATCHVTGIS
ncbi:MAG: hypothetical protein M3Y17_11750 [Actinomycetota bacterium]|nr:hypothetical protein [Actinomycetota bacterium]